MKVSPRCDSGSSEWCGVIGVARYCAGTSNTQLTSAELLERASEVRQDLSLKKGTSRKHFELTDTGTKLQTGDRAGPRGPPVRDLVRDLDVH